MSVNFFDTSVLLYIATIDRIKAERAEDLLRQRGTISVQVLNEITNVSRKKFGASWDDTFTLLSTVLAHTDVLPVTLEIHQLGLRLARRYGFAVYDSFIAAAAIEAGCDTLWSEDMQHGLVIDKRLRIANPFAE